MNFSTRHAFGIVVGVAVTIVAANALNMFLNWETAAIVCGLLLGLEAGFWSGIPQLTYQVHSVVFKTMLSPELWSAAFRVVKSIAYYATAAAGLALATYTAYKANMWLCHQPWLYQVLLQGGGDSMEITESNIIGMSWIGAPLLAIAMTWIVQSQLFDVLSRYGGGRWWKCSALHLPCGLAVGIVLPPAFMLFCVLAGLIMAAVAVLLIVVLAYSLLQIAARHEAVTITIGVIAGGISGLCYGRWTQLAFGPTLLSIMVGVAVGLASAYAAYRIGRKLQAANKPATATAS